jgi:acyl carrier protein
MENKIVKIAQKLFGSEIDKNSSIGSTPKWDSLGQINLFMTIEKEFEIKFTYDEIIENNSIKKIILLIETKL